MNSAKNVLFMARHLLLVMSEARFYVEAPPPGHRWDCCPMAVVEATHSEAESGYEFGKRFPSSSRSDGPKLGAR